MPHSAVRILALQLKRIGDAILTAPALASVRAAFPQAHIALMVGEHTEALAPAFAAVDEVIVWRGATVWPVLRQRWDVALDFSGTDRTMFLSALSRAPQRVGYEKAVSKAWWRRWVITQPCSAGVSLLHTLDYHAALVSSWLGKEAAEAGTGFAVPSGLVAAKGVNLPERYVVIHPGTFRPEKLWPARAWAEVITACPLPVLLTGAPGAVETDHVAEIMAETAQLRGPDATGVPSLTSLLGKLSLLELASLIQGAEVLLGVDSAAMHLAAMTQRPVIALFGPTNPLQWAPRHAEARILHAGGEGLRYKPKMKGVPMDQLPSERVITAMQEMIDRVC